MKESDNLVILGVIFDSKLTFEKHLCLVSRAVSQRLGILRKSWRVFHDRSLLERCFQGFVLPVFLYCSTVLCSDTHLKLLDADTHLKLLEHAVSGDSFLAGLWLSVTLLLLLLLLKKIGNARPWEGDWHPISPKTPAPHYQPIEEKRKQRENSLRQKRREQQANKKALDLLLKPANPTPSNTGSTGSFQRDTERGIKVLQFCSREAHKYTILR